MIHIPIPRKILQISLLIIVTCTSSAINSQSIWNPQSFSFSRDTISLENMAGSTPVNFTANFSSTPLADFPTGFTFKYGVTSYARYTISSYGYIKLGGSTTFVNPTLQDSIISALYCFPNSYTNCSYKMVGTAPNRKLVIEWSGSYVPNGQTVKFQLWLFERIGRIQFIYESGVKSYSSGNGYAIYCRGKILGQPVLASLKSRALNLLPLVNYAALQTNNYDSIYPKTRYTFQPDTVKPTRPVMSFGNIMAGCLDVIIKDSSVNESYFRIERKDSGSTYKLVSHIPSSTSLTQDTQYIYNNTRLQPDSLYYYQTYASNGFVNSDTVVQPLRTPMPMISGIKTIPGDYPSIKALLQDAQCKHIGPELIIELQSSYSFASETSPVYFNPFIQTRVLRHITVRPALATNLIISSSNPQPLFLIDSVKNVEIDGRAGGVGNTNNLTILQLDTLRPAVSYIRYADSGILRYCNIEGRCENSDYGLVYLGAYAPPFYNFKVAGVNGNVVSNCKIGPQAGYTYKGLVVESYQRGKNITIQNNEFFRFYNDAVDYRYGGSNSRVVNNRLYQPDVVPFLSNTPQANSAMTFTEVENNFAVDSNRIGGSSPTWGVGNWSQYLSSIPGNYAVIYLSTFFGHTSFIRYNEIANLKFTGFSRLREIQVPNGRVVISNNRIGSADSITSITNLSHHYPIQVGSTGTKIISNNFISGMQTDYPGFTANQDMALILASNVDSLIIIGNDIGGSNNPHANRSGSKTRGIDLLAVKNAIIKNNTIRGISSKNHGVWGIAEEWEATTATEKNMIADSNQIHHLEGKLTVFGMYARVYSSKKNSFSYNNIYALRGIGPSASPGASQPSINIGISVEHFPPPVNNSVIDTSEVQIFNNQVHSLEYYTPAANYIYQMTAIGASGRRIRVRNNMVRLGFGRLGLPTDSLELDITGINISPLVNAEIEHNSIYIGGTGHYAIGLDFPVNTSGSTGNKNIFLSNNIIQIDRYRVPSLGGVSYFRYTSSAFNNVVSNKNIWFSQRDPDIITKLNQWKTNCACDSATIIADPLFANPTGDSVTQNLHLLPGSSADSSGTPSVGVIPRDIDYDLRNNYSPVDIGADAITPCAGTANIELQLSPYQERIEICAGTTLNISATVNGGSVNQLQWQRNLNDIAGATGTNYTITQHGQYRVVGKLSCGKIASRSILVVEGISAPLLKLKSITRTPYCDSGRITFESEYVSNSQIIPQFKWYRNNTLQPLRTSASETFDGIKLNDTYRVEMIVNSACSNFTVKDSLKITAVSASIRPKIQVIQFDSLVCGGTSSTLKYRITNTNSFIQPKVLYISTIGSPIHTYVGDSLIIFNNLPAQLLVRLYVSDSLISCLLPDSTQTITINRQDSIPVPIVTIIGDTLISSSVSGNQWYKIPDEIIPGATSRRYSPIASGSYFVRVKEGECLSEKSNIVNIVLTGIIVVNPGVDILRIFPNPSKNHVWLLSEKINGLVSVSILDVYGRAVQVQELYMQLNLPVKMKLKNLSQGAYFLKLSDRGKSYLYKLVIHKD